MKGNLVLCGLATGACILLGRTAEASPALEHTDKAVPVVLTEFVKSAAHPRNSEGDVIGLRDGRLLVVYTRFYADPTNAQRDGGDDDSSAEIVMTISSDGGGTWSPARTVVSKAEGSLNVMSASLLRLGDGRLALFYLAKVSREDCRPMMAVSSDEGETWSDPASCVTEKDKGYYVLNNARAVRLASGRLALPLALHPFEGGNQSASAYMLCALSDDEGRTWRLSADRRRGTPPAGTEKLALQEPGLVELKDGRLMMYARSNERRQWRLYSADGGDHWTEPEPVTEYRTTTYSPVTYARLSDGRLVLVFNDGAVHAEPVAGMDRRWPLTVGVSSDEGKTWATKLLEPDDSVRSVHACYTAVREIGGRLVLVYCHRDALATSRVVSIPLDWLPTCRTDERVGAGEAVCVVGAHPDDLVGSAGLCCLLDEAGFSLHVIDFTRGELGLGMPGLRDGTTGRRRVEEERTACALLHAEAHFIDEVDGFAYASSNAVAQLAALFRSIRPRAVILHWPVDTHLDHVMSTAAALKALSLEKLDPEIYFFEETEQSMGFDPDVYVDVSSVIGRRADVIRAYACQNNPPWEAEPDWILKRKQADAKFRGTRMSPPVPFAEAFATYRGRSVRSRTIFSDLARQFERTRCHP